MKTIFFASGTGSNYNYLLNAINKNQLNLKPLHFFTNRYDCGALKISSRFKIPSTIISTNSFTTFSQWDNYLANLISTLNPDLVLLLGFLKKIGPITLSKCKAPILNTHPSLLPKYGGKGMFGRNVHKAVLDNNDTQSGITLHRVNSEYDKGDIVDQIVIDINNIKEVDALEAKVKSYEHDFLVQALKKFIVNPS
jgi:phosphoribosylglycinamide formyltransferase-1